jgi:DNA polymerase-1
MGIIMNKDIRKTFTKMKLGDSFSTDQLKYSAEDVAYLIQIMEQQKQFLIKHSLTKVSELEMNAIAPTADMELNGMFLDMDIWLKAEAIAIEEREVALLELDDIFSKVVPLDLFKRPMINYNSPLQVLEPLKKLMGAPGKHLKSTGEEVLKNFKHIPVVAKLLEYREKEKRVSTYGAAFFDYLNPVTRRIHTDFSQLRADTGRYASTSPNMQNIPALKAYRSAFTSGSPDYRIITCDYSGMELRILADLSKEPKWIEIFEKGLDAHCEVAV